MNKKTIIGIIVAIIVVIVAVVGYVLLNNNSENSRTEQTNNENRGTIAQNNNGETNNNAENTENTNNDRKILTLYFSETGNTEKFANIIHEQVGGDIVKIESVTQYPEVYEELADYAEQERDNDARPEIANLDEININDYDTIFIGYPIWWYQMPMIMYTLFDNYDFSGKTIIPFNTHEGSRDSGTYDDIQELEPNATVLEGLPIRGGDMQEDQTQTISDWLAELGF